MATAGPPDIFSDVGHRQMRFTAAEFFDMAIFYFEECVDALGCQLVQNDVVDSDEDSDHNGHCTEYAKAHSTAANTACIVDLLL